MPGFLDGLFRMAKGEPVFKPGDTSKDTSGSPPSQNMNLTNGPKERPLLVVERVESRDSGSNCQVTFSIQNNASEAITLERIEFLGSERRYSEYFRAGQEREVVVFNSNRPMHRNYSYAELEYKTDAGDYFQANHSVEYRQEADGTYSVYRLRFVGPVKDI